MAFFFFKWKVWVSLKQMPVKASNSWRLKHPGLTSFSQWVSSLIELTKKNAAHFLLLSQVSIHCLLVHLLLYLGLIWFRKSNRGFILLTKKDCYVACFYFRPLAPTPGFQLSERAMPDFCFPVSFFFHRCLKSTCKTFQVAAHAKHISYLSCVSNFNSLTAVLLTPFVSVHNLSIYTWKKLPKSNKEADIIKLTSKQLFQHSFHNGLRMQADVDLYCFTIWLKYNAF